MEKRKHIDPLTAAWSQAMAEAGFEDGEAKQVLNAVRDSAPDAQPAREQFYRVLAQQVLAWYRTHLQGKELSPDELLRVVQWAQEQAEADDNG